MVRVQVRYYGTGIPEEALPDLLEAGASPAGPIRHGLPIMPKTADRVWLIAELGRGWAARRSCWNRVASA